MESAQEQKLPDYMIGMLMLGLALHGNGNEQETTIQETENK